MSTPLDPGPVLFRQILVRVCPSHEDDLRPDPRRGPRHDDAGIEAGVRASIMSRLLHICPYQRPSPVRRPM